MNRHTHALVAAWIVALSCVNALPARGADSIDQRIEQAVAQARAADDAEHERGVAALDQAIKELEAAPQQQGAAEAHRQSLIGKAYLYSGRLDAAVKHLDKALELAPDIAEGHYLRAVAFEAASDAPHAGQEFVKATELAPGESRYWYQLGIFRAGDNQIDAALTAFRKAVELDPKNAKATLETGAMLAEQGKLDEALALFKKAAALDPNYLLAHANVGQVCQNQGKHAEALEAFRAVVKLNPGDSRALAKIIQCEDALGKLKERDEDHAAMIKLHKAGKIREKFFCRDQFSVGKTKLMVFEYFELQGQQPVRYSFNVLDEAGKTGKFRISLGSSEMDNQIAFEQGKINKGERVYFVDVDFPDGSHETLAHYVKKEPTYDELKKLAIGRVKGEVKPVSSFTPGKADGEKNEPKK